MKFFIKTSLLFLFLAFFALFPRTNSSLVHAESYEEMSNKFQATCKKLVQEFQGNNQSGGTFCDIRGIRQPSPRRYSDIKVQINSIEFELFDSNEKAKKRLESMDEFSTAPSSDKTRTIRNSKIPGGFIFVVKDRLEQLDNEFVAGSVVFGQQKGSCALKVYSGTYPDLIDQYHVFSVSVEGGKVYYDNKHTGFYHDREEELRTLVQSVANKVWDTSAGLCGNQKSKDTVATQNYDSKDFAKSELDQRPKASDFTKISLNEFTKVYPVSTISATPSPKITSAASESAKPGDVFIGKVTGEGKVVIELPDGQQVSLKDNKTVIDNSDYIISNLYSNLLWNIYADRSQFIVDIDHIKVIKQTWCTLKSAWYFDTRGLVKIQGRWDQEKNRCFQVIVIDGFIRVLADDESLLTTTPGEVTIMPNKADFLVGYNSSTKQSAIEIYDGSLTIQNKTGQSKTISSSYGSEIKRIDVDQNGEMIEKIAIPQSQWEAFLASQQKETESEPSGNVLPIIAIAILSMGGTVFFLHRKGKLMPLYKSLSQKISGIKKKIKKDRQEEKTT